MTLYKNKYRIEPDRAQFWDYWSPGSYFITVCVQNREQILGFIKNNKMILSDEGKIVAGFFAQLPSWNKRIILDEWIIMPNHFHCLITLGDYSFNNGISADTTGGNDNDTGDDDVDKIHEFYLRHQYRKMQNPTTDQIKQYRKLRRKMLIPKIMGKLQMQTSKHINLLNNTPGNKTWQKGYHDHIIRNDDEFQRIKIT